jgi:glucan phosphoethanolaminetransferase (alkaline phosphatase superfamily)
VTYCFDLCEMWPYESFNPEHGGSVMFRNICIYLKEHRIQQTKFETAYLQGSTAVLTFRENLHFVLSYVDFLIILVIRELTYFEKVSSLLVFNAKSVLFLSVLHLLRNFIKFSIVRSGSVTNGFTSQPLINFYTAISFCFLYAVNPPFIL